MYSRLPQCGQGEVRVAMDLAMEAYSSSDEAALNLLKRLAGRTVSIEVTFGDKSLIGVVAGIFSVSPSGEEFTVSGAGTVSFELNSLDVSSCKFDERRSELPTIGDAAMDVRIG